MANILDIVTLGEKSLYSVDADPAAGAGTAAPIGSVASYDNGSLGQLYLKTGAADTAWDRIPTLTSGANVAQGVFGRVAIYNQLPNGYQVDDQIPFTSFLLDVVIGSHTLAANREYTVPDVGANANFVMSEGAQTVNGDKTFGNNVVIQGNLTVNGSLTSVNTTNTNITDKLVTLNKGGGAASAGQSGLEFEEAGSITGYIYTTVARDGLEFKAPAIASDLTIDLTNLTSNRILNAPDESGKVLIRSNTAAVVGQIPFYATANRLDNEAGTGADSLAWDATNNRLGIRTAAPNDALEVAGNARVSGVGSVIRLLAASDQTTRQAAVTTTDATLTTIDTIAIPTNSMVIVESTILGRKTTGAGAGAVGDGAAYVRTARFKNVAGTVTRVTLQSDYTSEDVVGWSADILASGTNAIVRVQGSANNTMLWETTSRVTVLD